MSATDDVNYELFVKGWKDQTIGVAALDGYTENILFSILDRPSKYGWRAAKWMHRSAGIAGIVLGYKFSWWWLLLLLLALIVRRAYYEEARKEIGRRCAESEPIFQLVKDSGVVAFRRRS